MQSQITEATRTVTPSCPQPAGNSRRRKSKSSIGYLTRNQKKELLMQYRRLDEKIERRIYDCRAWQQKLHTLEGMEQGAMQQAHLDISRREQQAANEIESCVGLKAQIEQLIRELPGDACQTVLEYRYLEGMPWSQISETMNYSIQHLFRLHNHALDIME